MKLLFIFTAGVMILNLITIILLLFKVEINFPRYKALNVTHWWLFYPSFFYQLYWWVDYFNLLN